MLGRLSLVVSLLAVCAFALGAGGAAGAHGATRVQLTIRVSGSGTVSAVGHRVTCAEASCSKTFLVQPGTVRLKAAAAPTWKFTTWGLACHGNRFVCTLRVRRAAIVSATFVPPGARVNPIRLGTTAGVGAGWSLTVISVKPDASQEVLAVKEPNGESANRPPPQGAQDFMVLVNAIYEAGGKGNPTHLLNHLYAEGSHKARYDTQENSCGTWPEPSFQYAPDVFPGQNLTGNVCFQVAANDASSLMLYTELPNTKQVWFALR